jgi:hypothetical protein
MDKFSFSFLIHEIILEGKTGIASLFSYAGFNNSEQLLPLDFT